MEAGDKCSKPSIGWTVSRGKRLMGDGNIYWEWTGILTRKDGHIY